MKYAAATPLHDKKAATLFKSPELWSGEHLQADVEEDEQLTFESQIASLNRQVERLRIEAEQRMREEEEERKQQEVARQASGDCHDESGEESGNDEDTDDEKDETHNEYINENTSEVNSLTFYGRDGPLFYFRSSGGANLSVHRCILPSQGIAEDVAGRQTVLRDIANLPAMKPWGFLLLAGGHFAGAVVHQGKAIVHKCYHRYVVRAKRGTAQSARDGKSGTSAPKSAGANIRRHNEAMLDKDIRMLLKEWQPLLQGCDIIFLQAPVYKRSIFFGSKGESFNGQLLKSDSRMRSFPIPTQRPTMKEIMRLYQILATVYHYEGEPGALKAEKAKVNSTKEYVKARASSSQKDQTQEAEQIMPVVASEDAYVNSKLYAACEEGDVKEVKALIESGCAGDLGDVNYGWNENAEVALHVASQKGNGELVKILLEAGSDPGIKDVRGRVPYDVAADKEIRNIYRRFMAAYPDRYNYHIANIPGPLTPEMEAAQMEKKAEKAKKDKAKQKARKKAAAKKAKDRRAAEEQEAAEKAEREAKEAEKQKNRLSKSAEARERRAQAALARMNKSALSDQYCDYCGKDLPNDAFSRDEYRYDTIDCLKRHRLATQKK